MLLDHLQSKLDALAAAGLARSVRSAATPTAVRQTVLGADGTARALRMFCSNDYLGFAGDPRLAEALAEGARAWGAGAGASHLISGHSVAHARLQDDFADWYAPYIPGARAITFCTGYLANIAVLTALGDADAQIFSDKLNHASLIDGCLLARAAVQRYPHADLAALRRQLQASRARIKLIVTDGVFSMDGDIAPLAALLVLAEEFDTWLVVDDAHGFGVLGRDGRGTLEHFGVRSERIVLVGTLGKAAGISGAFVAAHPRIVQYLLQAARPYVFSTATPPAIAHALRTSLALIGGPDGRAARARLAQLGTRLGEGLAGLLRRRPALPWRPVPSTTPIHPLVIGGNDETMRLAAALEARGLRVPGIRPPTVPAGTARLRITLCAAHGDDDVDALLAALDEAAAP
ncbi:8-amino-7-oxononanoate synthase [Xylophilus sp.]|uniref:8-amino-7-oxononanoate synthase n=1 Tax=Xylophilus sp. TaxID=2653893 RepID=UPI0013B8D949|nr:8-amino-7-oxononanoate synthase [Xylophilus sp.]KAF1044689.1 MAG: 8-amino-7-oxononanoate synthase [Xylophilus sp.]